MKPIFSIALHGGAGTIRPAEMTPEKEILYRNALQNALEIGIEILEKGGSSLEAVAFTVAALEDCELFNAGKGAVFTHEGTHELDASIMEGKDLRAGSVIGVRRVEHPILLAKEILHHSQHVTLVGSGAESFAQTRNIPLVTNEFFSTDFRRKQWDAVKDTAKTQLDHFSPNADKKGTVGAVAIDLQGNLAAATSTGGMTNKNYGRVGDTPLIGSGTYAKNGVCAVSATGWGEFFIRGVVAYDIACLMQYKGLSLKEATHVVIQEKLPALSPIEGEYGDGGVIAVDALGNISMEFNTEGMYRAAYKSGESVEIGLYK